MPGLKIRRALFTVSDKEGIEALARALVKAGAEIVATGKTAVKLQDAGIKVVPIERISGSPEAFQGRMKTLSFPVCSGILARRGDASDDADLARLSILPIDCVVVNFYPFEQAAAKIEAAEMARDPSLRKKLIEEVDIGGPTLVRAAAKNAPDVLVLTSPEQYRDVITAIERDGAVPAEIAHACAAQAWERILDYDRAIAERLGSRALAGEAAGPSAGHSAGHSVGLRYGENPHQKATLEIGVNSPIDWPRTPEERLTNEELSYNNILDLTAAYGLASDLARLEPGATSVVIVKHNNPCGVASVPKTAGGSLDAAQKLALLRAWEGDPVSAFGGVLVFTDPLGAESAAWLSERFVELIAAPGLAQGNSALATIAAKRKKLKAVRIQRFGGMPRETAVQVPGGVLRQSADLELSESLRAVTTRTWPENFARLGHFGIAVCRTLKSNAIALVREMPGQDGGFQLIGAGQGQPNRIEALKALAIPRAQGVLRESGGNLSECVMISDAFFPFRDTVDAAYGAGIRFIVQPGGSIKDDESIAAANEHGMAMAVTGTRHFRH